MPIYICVYVRTNTNIDINIGASLVPVSILIQNHYDNINTPRLTHYLCMFLYNYDITLHYIIAYELHRNLPLAHDLL